MMKTHAFRASLVALAIGSAFGAGYAINSLTAVTPVHAAAATETKQSTPTPLPTVAANTLPDFATLVANQGPAVVSVHMSRETAVSEVPPLPQGPEGNDNPFGEFFRRFQLPPEAFGERVPQQGSGSGFIVNPDGYILTNAHVVDGATQVTVTLVDKREFAAKVVGTDRRTDVALLKIDAKDLPSVKIGNPDQSRVGDWVAAIGAPFGLDNTVTAGIISAKSRSLPDSGYVPFLQTDVAVNPGNSGGPLFNMRGEVIGINSQIYSRTGGYMGLSFAIPIDLAMDVKEQLQAHGKVTRGRIGVAVQDLTRELAQSFGLKDLNGAIISSVEKGAPAEKAGLQAGDIITTINGKKVENSSEVARLIAKSAPGSKAEIAVLRNGAGKTFNVALAEAPSETVALAGQPGASAQAKLGVAVRPLTAQEQERTESAGVVVEQVSGAAKRAGIRSGDIIVGVNSEPVESPQDLKRLVEQAGKRAALLIERGGNRLFVPIELG
jgi:serine protease Do